GDYLVCEVLKSLYTQSAPSGTDCSGISGVAAGGFKLTVTSSGTSAGNDFRSEERRVGKEGKSQEPNANGMKNVGNEVVANWYIEVYTDAVIPVFAASDTTTSLEFCRVLLRPGDYLVCEVLKSLYTQSAPSGTDCSGISGVAAGGFKLTVTSSGTSAGNDF